LSVSEDGTGMLEHDFQREVSKKYSLLARFKGKQLSLNQQAINKVSKVITSRVNETNVDTLYSFPP
jgi:hypothetical protein